MKKLAHYGMCFLGLLLICALMNSCDIQRGFSETDWKSHQSVRASMADSLVAKLNLEKPIKNRVEELLGPRMDLDNFKDDLRSYFLKSDSSIVGTGATYLSIEFENGSFKSATIVHQN